MSCKAIPRAAPSPAGHAEERENGAAKARAAPRNFASVSVVVIVLFIFVFLFLLAYSRSSLSSAVRRFSSGIESIESRDDSARLPDRQTPPIDVTRTTLRNPARRRLTADVPFVDRHSCVHSRAHARTHARSQARRSQARTHARTHIRTNARLSASLRLPALSTHSAS